MAICKLPKIRLRMNVNEMTSVGLTCLASDQLGKLGTWCKPNNACDDGVCTNGVCLTIQTGGLGQPCNANKSCSQAGLTCTDLQDGAGSKCYCADDANIGKACDAAGSECVGNSFNKKFQYIYPQMYVTVAGDTTQGVSQLQFLRRLVPTCKFRLIGQDVLLL